MLFCLFYLGIFDMMYPIISRESAGDGISRQNTSLFTSEIQKCVSMAATSFLP